MNMRHNVRSKVTGRFITRPSVQNIVAGRLYGYRGAVVRAGKDRIIGQSGTPQRHVSFHKSLFGFVPEHELQWVDNRSVNQYLQKA
jgi:hypothetical protein